MIRTANKQIYLYLINGIIEDDGRKLSSFMADELINRRHWSINEHRCLPDGRCLIILEQTNECNSVCFR